MDHGRNRQLLIGLLALGWLLAVFIGYIYMHKPFVAAELNGILLGFWRTLVAITIISIAGGVGFLTDLRKLDLHPFALAMLTAALGLGIMGIGVLLAGVTIGINLFLWVILVVIAVLLRKQILAWLQCWQPVGDYWQKTGGLGKVILCLTIIILTCQYFIALAPPLQFDALTYHFAIPNAYIQTGRIVYLSDNMFWGMPQQVEMLHTLSMLLGGAEAAQALGWWMSVLTLAGLVGVAEKTFSRDSAWVAAASLMCASAMTVSIPGGYVEWATILFGLAMSVCLIEWIPNKNRSVLALAGIFAGLALATKYTAGVALLAGFVVIVFFRKPYSFKQTMIDLTVFGGIAAALTLPWWIKNILATSNPFYPLLIPSGAMDAVRLAQYQAKTLAPDWSRLLLLPVQATVRGLDGGEGFSASIGPLLLGLSPLAFFGWREKTDGQRAMIKISATILLTGFLIWATASQFGEKLIQTRLYFVIFPAWALLCASGYMTISKVKAPGIRFGNISAAFIVMALAFNTFFSVVNLLRSGAALAALNPEMGQSYRENNLGAYVLAMQALKTLPEDARIVMLWETRGFECLPKCDSDEVIDRWPSDWASQRDQVAIVKAWKEQGYTHLLINQLGADFVRSYDKNGPSPEAWAGMDAMLASLPLVENIAGSYEIYALP